MFKLLYCIYGLFYHYYTIWKHEHHDEMTSYISYQRIPTYTNPDNSQELLGILQQEINYTNMNYIQDLDWDLAPVSMNSV